MKWLILFLFLPFASRGQTIHFEDEKIIYKGAVNLTGLSAKEVFARFEPAFASVLEQKNVQTNAVPDQNKMSATSNITLSTPFYIIRKVHFTIHLAAKEGGYTYQLDSVYVTEARRGREPEIKTSEELLEGMEETGNAAAVSEKLLNEIDMRFQKLLTVFEKRMRELK